MECVLVNIELKNINIEARECLYSGTAIDQSPRYFYVLLRKRVRY